MAAQGDLEAMGENAGLIEQVPPTRGELGVRPLESQYYCSLLCGGKWNWVHSSTDRGKHVPLLVPMLLVAIAVGYWGMPGPYGDISPADKPFFRYVNTDQTWYTVFSTFFVHSSDLHVVGNLLNTALAGLLLELTEGSLRVLAVTVASQCCAMGAHGAMVDSAVVGASGATYGYMWAQLALLALNWREMQMRWGRALLMVGLLMFDVFTWKDQIEGNVAVWAHAGGAAGAVCVGVCLGVNVRKLPHELALNWVGVVGYAGLCAWLLAAGQSSAGILGALLLPVLIAASLKVSCASAAQTGTTPAAAPVADSKL
jgi:membrane associated rhomboid family serine protease